MEGILSKGISLQYSATVEGSYKELEGLQAIPDLGGSAETVETTTLKNSNKTYIPGIKDFGELEFTFLYDNSEGSTFRTMRAIEESNSQGHFKVVLPDSTTFAFSGKVVTKIAGVGVGEAITFTLTIVADSDITVTNPQ